MQFIPFLLTLCLLILCSIFPPRTMATTEDSPPPLTSVISLLLSGSYFYTPQNVTVKVNGLAHDSLTLVLNDGENLTISANGTSSFSTKLKSFYNYEVKLKSVPTSPDQGCKLSNATGMIILEEAVVTVDCSTTGYEPNSYGEWQEQPEANEPPLSLEGTADHWNHREDDDYYSQPGKLFQLMAQEPQQVLFDNTARAMGDAPKEIKMRHIGNCMKADPAYGKGVAKALSISIDELT